MSNELTSHIFSEEGSKNSKIRSAQCTESRLLYNIQSNTILIYLMMTTKFDAVTSIPTKQKPPRPLTAYHLFFQLEREYILQTTPDDGVGSSAPKDTRPIGKQIDNDMPFRYRYIHLNEHWYAR